MSAKELVAAFGDWSPVVRGWAAEAIKKMGGAAKPAVPEILKALVQTAEPLLPVNWADPIQLTHGQLAATLFAGPLADAVQAALRLGGKWKFTSE